MSVNKGRYSRGVAIVLVCLGANILSHADRNMLIVMIDVVRSDLGFSDTQIGLIHGLAFSLSFSVFTIVFASLADRMARGNLIAIAICLWSIATVLFGFATGFLSMFLARMGVGLGQAMLSPTVYSLLASNFPRYKLARASSWYVSGSFLGVALVITAGGYLAKMSSEDMSVSIPYIASFPVWRAGFIGAGTIGLIFAIAVPFLIKDQRGVDDKPSPTFGNVLQFVMEHRDAVVRHFAGFSFCALAMFTLIAWGPAYFMRVQGVGAATVGVTLALGFLISNVSGVLISGVVTDYLARSGIQGGPFIVGGCAALLTAISMVFFVLGGDGGGSIIAFFLGLHFSSYVIAPSATALQMLAPERMRARMYALFLSLNNLIGMSIGAIVVGLLNDYVFRSPSAVGISMAITVSVAAALGGGILASGRPHFVASLKRLEAGRKL